MSYLTPSLRTLSLKSLSGTAHSWAPLETDTGRIRTTKKRRGNMTKDLPITLLLLTVIMVNLLIVSLCWALECVIGASTLQVTGILMSLGLLSMIECFECRSFWKFRSSQQTAVPRRSSVHREADKVLQAEVIRRDLVVVAVNGYKMQPIDHIGDSCPICLESMLPSNDNHYQNDSIVRGQQCVHCFHQECLVAWVQQQGCCSTTAASQQCPCCRSDLFTPEAVMAATETTA